MNENLMFYLKTGGFGFITGFFIGFALKKLSKLLVIFIGIILISIQLLVYNGLVNINWTGFETSTNEIIANQEGILNSLKTILFVNIPFAGAAGIGFLLGLKKG